MGFSFLRAFPMAGAMIAGSKIECVFAAIKIFR
jgi:hypothetical protein